MPYLSIKRNKVLIHATTCQTKETDTKSHTLDNFIYMKCPEWANAQRENKPVVAKGWLKKEMWSIMGLGFFWG